MGYIIIWLLSGSVLILGILLLAGMTSSPETVYEIIYKISGIEANAAEDSLIGGLIGPTFDFLLYGVAIGLILIGGIILRVSLRTKTISDVTGIFWRVNFRKHHAFRAPFHHARVVADELLRNEDDDK